MGPRNSSICPRNSPMHKLDSVQESAHSRRPMGLAALSHFVRIGLVISLALGSPLFFARAGAAQPGTATVEGTATGAKGEVLPKYTVRLRNVDTNQIVGTTASDEKGNFRFNNVPAGNVVVEVLDANGNVIATTAAIAVAAGAALVGINVGAGGA